MKKTVRPQWGLIQEPSTQCSWRLTFQFFHHSVRPHPRLVTGADTQCTVLKTYHPGMFILSNLGQAWIWSLNTGKLEAYHPVCPFCQDLTRPRSVECICLLHAPPPAWKPSNPGHPRCGSPSCAAVNHNAGGGALGAWLLNIRKEHRLIYTDVCHCVCCWGLLDITGHWIYNWMF